MKGYIHIYTGEGKGKTTACLGLLLRALVAGYKVFFCQFLKESTYSEIKMLKKLCGCMAAELEIRQYGVKRKVSTAFTNRDKEAAARGFQELKAAVAGNQYNLAIADEICVAIHYGLIPLAEVIDMLKTKPQNLELVLTGRYTCEELCTAADLVTEMKLVKHYYQEGIMARKGIEF